MGEGFPYASGDRCEGKYERDRKLDSSPGLTRDAQSGFYLTIFSLKNLHASYTN